MFTTKRPGKTAWAAAGLTLALAAVAQAGSAEIEQITGNVQTTVQTGDQNSATVEQSAVAAGLVPGANLAGITQEGSQNRAEIRQQGSGLEAEIAQTGDANAASIDQRGTGLTAGVEQFGDGGGVQIFQSGTGDGLPVTVRQY